MKRDWRTIRERYLEGGVTLRQLAEETGISFSTLGKRAVRERWSFERERRGNALATAMETSALRVAEEKGKQLGEVTGEAFTKRCVSETVAWLDRVQEVAEREPLSSENLPKLTGSWRAVVSAGREALGLDATHGRFIVSAEVMFDLECRAITGPERSGLIVDMARDPHQVAPASPTLAIDVDVAGESRTEHDSTG